MGRMRRLALVFVVLALIACGLRLRRPTTADAAPVTVALDFVPNPVHAPIYMAGDAREDPQARRRARTRSSS